MSKINHIRLEQLNCAISDKDGFVKIYANAAPLKQTYHSPGAIPVGRVRSLSLDSLIRDSLKEGESLTHVKMDIDGYEPAFFAGGKDTLKKFNPLIMMEFWPKGLKVSGWDLDDYWNMLQDDYSVKEASFPSRLLHPLSRKDLTYLIEKTKNGITNLVLIPRPA